MEIIDWPLSKRTINSLVSAGYKNIDDLKLLSLDKLKEIKGLGSKAILEIRDYCKLKFDIVFKSEPKKKKKVLSDYVLCKQIVEHFLSGKFNWANQLKVADQLLKKHGIELLLKVRPNKSAYSLVWYNTSYGEAYIKQFIPGEVQEQEEKEEVKFEEVPIDFSVGIKKPLSLEDFLK